jgi:hypothetical protein
MIVAKLRRVVLDTLKPHEPNIVLLALALTELPGVAAANITLVDMDARVESVKITLEGDAIDFDQVRELLIELGTSVHSIDQVVAGDAIIEARATPQD